MGHQYRHQNQHCSSKKDHLNHYLGIGLCLALLVSSQELAAAPGAIAPETQQAMVEAIQDEYRARALYQAIIEKFGVIRPFSKIIHSETRHAEHLSQLFRKYNLPIPEDTFAYQVDAPATVQEACRMAIAAEIDNVEMYDRFLDFVQEDDLRTTFTQLRSISLNRHKPAFERCLNSRFSQL